MEKIKIFLVMGDNLKIPKEIEDYLHNNFIICSDVSESEIIMVCGGDGMMLETVRKFRFLGIPFCGLNFGHVGFLMNSPEIEKLEEIASNSTEISSIKLLEAKTFGSKGSLLGIEYAFNEFYMERSDIPTAKVRVSVNGKIEADPLICDGIIVCSSAGSTAYNAAAGGIILHLGANSIILTGICPATFHKWKTIQLSIDSKIEIEAVEFKKRPVRFLTDGIKVDNVVKAEITCSQKEVSLIFANTENYHDKVLALQFKRFRKG